jgi:hypothetical protein
MFLGFIFWIILVFLLSAYIYHHYLSFSTDIDIDENTFVIIMIVFFSLFYILGYFYII